MFWGIFELSLIFALPLGALDDRRMPSCCAVLERNWCCRRVLDYSFDLFDIHMYTHTPMYVYLSTHTVVHMIRLYFRQQIRTALNQQTTIQFKQYAKEQCPNNVDQVRCCGGGSEGGWDGVRGGKEREGV